MQNGIFRVQAAKVYINDLTSQCGPDIMLSPKIPKAKPIPARRLTSMAPEFNKSHFASPSPVAAARIVKRRSTNLDQTNGKNTTNATINHQRQRVLFGRIKSTNQKTPPSGTETDDRFSIKIPKAGRLKFGFCCCSK